MAELADIGPGLEACFEEIRSGRMAGIPILNEALSVKAVGVRSWNGFRFCVLITPWFMNLMALPDVPDEEPVATGTKRMFAFPAGSFEFIAGGEEAIGPFWMCSLFSPVLEFSDQKTAEATAAAALAAIFESGDETEDSERDMALMWRGEVPVADEGPQDGAGQAGTASVDETEEPRVLGRRAFLRGGLTVEDRP